jgi:hypothetical protein
MSEQLSTESNRPAPRRWTKEEEQELVKFTEVNTPNSVIASKMGRTSDSVRKKAAAIGLTRGAAAGRSDADNDLEGDQGG